MSTIASPRASITLSSRRTSTSTDTITSGTAGPGAAERGHLRRNRIALRDYYNLTTPSPSTGAASASTENLPSTEPPSPSESSELDAPSFDPQTYITHLLSTQNLQAVWRAEASLVTQTRSLDGEKKALVYDNYAKLIAATETIRRMRERMDPLTPATSTLSPAVSHIAETAERLAGELRGPGKNGEVEEKERRREGVRWVLQAPGRLGGLVEGGKREEAEEEWGVVRRLLEKWEGVRGVDEVRRKCEAVMAEADRRADGT